MRRSFVRRSAVWATTLLCAVATACSEDSTGPGGPVVTTDVTVGPGTTFNPSAIQVSPGATVTWTWSENAAHNINFASASIADEPNRSTGAYATAMPVAAGTYTYQCNFHSGMNGSVLVQ